MKKQYLFFLYLSSFSLLLTAQTYNLVDSFYEGSSGIEASTRVKVDQYGGTIVSDRIFTNDCAGDFHIKWSFSKDITSLRDGDEFIVYTYCDGCTSSCGFRSAIAVAGSAGNITSIPGFNYAYNGNMEVVASNTKSFTSDDWYKGYSSASFTVRVKSYKTVKYTAFYLTIGNHKVYYVYEYGSSGYIKPISKTNSKNLNCISLVSVGQLVGGLSIGAYEGYGYSWMVQAIDYALEHLEATNCMSTSYLKDLRRRINYAPNTKVFLNEIRAYEQSLYDEASKSCAACKRCSE